MLLNKLLNKLFVPNTVAGVLNTFQETITSLEKVAKHHIAKVEKYEDKIETLLAEVDDAQERITTHEDEANLALKTANKLNNFFGLNE